MKESYRNRADHLENLRRMGPDQLQAELESLEKAALDSRMEAGSAVETNIKALKMRRREIARMKTVIREKEIEAEAEAESTDGQAQDAGNSPGGEG
ncbi:MAG: 50S ribosomal protein L29 [Deltaproteobacteria bacterium]|nr:50S ribosomal protein L29 [Deltaproteobacteria bacterium]